MPNVEIKPMSPLVLVLVRALRSGLQAFVAVLSITGIASVGDLQRFISLLPLAGAIGVGATFWSLVQNALELLNKIDEKWPEARG